MDCGDTGADKINLSSHNAAWHTNSTVFVKLFMLFMKRAVYLVYSSNIWQILPSSRGMSAAGALGPSILLMIPLTQLNCLDNVHGYIWVEVMSLWDACRGADHCGLRDNMPLVYYIKHNM